MNKVLSKAHPQVGLTPPKDTVTTKRVIKKKLTLTVKPHKPREFQALSGPMSFVTSPPQDLTVTLNQAHRRIEG